MSADYVRFKQREDRLVVALYIPSFFKELRTVMGGAGRGVSKMYTERGTERRRERERKKHTHR